MPEEWESAVEQELRGYDENWLAIWKGLRHFDYHISCPRLAEHLASHGHKWATCCDSVTFWRKTQRVWKVVGRHMPADRFDCVMTAHKRLRKSKTI